ncbi:YggS family pyridoxal phosphate-dependent enzyme [Candidatus Poribacteria bacterium]|nr:YggS family pyridoxal phosphate-dependent enzyme [Candidatus Poribacteria bacterium]
MQGQEDEERGRAVLRAPSLADNLARVRERIAAAAKQAGRDPASITLVGVSKNRPADQTRQLFELGVRDFGENRVQEAQAKIPQMPAGPVWHLIGRLQTNKVKYLPGLVHAVHSVDRLEVAQALDTAFARHGLKVRVLLQVNVTGEEQKGGVEPSGAEALLDQVRSLPALELEGLMTMAPYGAGPEGARRVFSQLRTLRDRLAGVSGMSLAHLSMGMSGDFEAAIHEGATLVRIGTALYEG